MRIPSFAASRFVAAPSGSAATTQGNTALVFWSAVFCIAMGALFGRPESVAAGDVAGAADFQGITAGVDLPGYRPDQLTTPVEIAKPIAGSFDAVKLTLLNADAPLTGLFERYELEAEPAAGAWRVVTVNKAKVRRPIGRFQLTGSVLVFQFETSVTRVDGGPLRNCVVVVDDGATRHAVALRAAVRQPAWPLDLKKDLSRFALPDDLPEPNELKLEVKSVAKGPIAVTVGPAPTSLKESSFADLKAADAANPGARLRIVLWKSGPKLEVLVRPEVTPMEQAGPNQPQPGQPQPVQPQAATPPAAAVDDFDPNAAKLKTPSFTIRGLADIKLQLNRELSAGQNKVKANLKQIASNDQELKRYSMGILAGSQAEAQAHRNRISNLRSENTQLKNANQNYTTVTLPNLSRQLAACPTLEELAGALDGKAELSFRVYYTVAGKPIDALVVGGD